MKAISELAGILRQYFAWNKSRLDCLSRMLLALFVVRTVNLSEIAVAMMSHAGVNSRYKRLQRFFRYFQFDYNGMLPLFLVIIPKIEFRCDRTQNCTSDSNF